MVSSRRLAVTVLIVVTLGQPSAGWSSEAAFPTGSRGAWTRNSGEERLNVTESHIVHHHNGLLKVRKLLSIDRLQAKLRFNGTESWVAFYVQDEHLYFADRSFERVSPIPDDLQVLTPFQIPQPSAAAASDIEAAQGLLRLMIRNDQRLRKERRPPDELRRAGKRHAEKLKGILRNQGWIDIHRFGPEAAMNAFLVVQHSNDLPLMLSALPLIKSDLENLGGREAGDMFALLFDRIRVRTGELQRYGSQLNEDATGPYVLPLEDPCSIDDLRQAIGLEPLQEYVAIASKEFYAGRPVRLLTPCEH